MRDKREPTRANGAQSEVDVELANRLPRTLGSRLRAARMAAGLSQGAVAKAMAERGFSWRQTTVAKSEAADRPVLFAEVAALAQLYRRPIDYFIYPGAELDSLLDQATSELQSVAGALGEALNHVKVLRRDARIYECTVGLMHALVRYRGTSDGGLLLADVQYLLSEYDRLVLEIDDAYEAIGLTEVQVATIDEEILREVARAGLRRYEYLTREDLEWESPELLNNLSTLAEGGEVGEDFLDFMRKTTAWPDFVALSLTDLVRGAIDLQRD